MTIKGTKDNDDLTGTTGDDLFIMTQGGDDTVHGGRGDDIFQYGDKLTAADHIDGGNGVDTLVLGGDYTGANAFTFDGVNITKIEALQLRAGFSYEFTFTGLTNSIATFTLDGRALGAGDSLTVDASAMHDVAMLMTGGAGDDVLTGGSFLGIFDLTRGGDDTATGGDKADTFRMGAALSAGDRIDGGGGGAPDRIELKGHYGGPGLGSLFAFDDDTIANIDTVELRGNFDYGLRFADGNLAADQMLTIDASQLGVHRTVVIDASAESDGTYDMLASAGDNILIGGAGNDTFQFDGNFDAGDSVDGGDGFDTILFGQVSGLVVSPGNVGNVEKLAFSGMSDMAVSGSFATLHLDGTETASFTADVAGATIGQLTFQGGEGDDTLIFGGDISSSDFVDGGKGFDTVVFDAPSLTLNLDGHFESVEKIVLRGAASTYDVTLDTSFDPAEGTVFVDASALTDPSSSLHLDASDQNGSFLHVVGGAGDDTIITGLAFDTIDGGAGDDIITGGNQGDTLTGGAGSDVFVYTTAADSNAPATSYDRITDFDANADFLQLPFAVTYDGATSGSVTRPAQDLAAIVNPLLTAHGAVLVDVTGGHLAGHILLAIDADNDGAFTNADYVIDLKGMTNEASFGAADFIT